MPMNQTQPQPKGQPTEQNPVIQALSVLQAFVLQQKEQNRPNADSLMSVFQQLLETIKGNAMQKPQEQPAPQQNMQNMRGNRVLPMNMGQRNVNQTNNAVPII